MSAEKYEVGMIWRHGSERIEQSKCRLGVAGVDRPPDVGHPAERILRRSGGRDSE
jgi:hypothetical protein